MTSVLLTFNYNLIVNYTRNYRFKLLMMPRCGCLIVEMHGDKFKNHEINQLMCFLDLQTSLRLFRFTDLFLLKTD